MAQIVLFHHVQGLTAGVHRLADELRAAGHTVHTPDFLDGETFASIEEGFAAVTARGSEARDAWADAAVADLPPDVVLAGISLGVMPAQRLAQTRPGALAAVLLEACVPPEEFGAPWPQGVAVQVHGMDADPFFAGDGDIDAARALVTEVDDGELFTYPGDAHLFTDSSLPTYDAAATELVVQRVLSLLERVSPVG